MYLKRLELCGFKSFADRTKLDFEPGISSIIGPNGCGKSNTLDAIRWCLGEQSARSMRSHQMMDVIFGGSQSRATTGMAEVSLTFDNSQNMLPIDYSEVTVTRRLFRSGESEYFINKVQCRLKDIRDLFLDTGIGTDGYSIIEQGKVEFLLMAKPEERREMFEEAAGVSKYKVRREETLRKLEKVEIDMNRVSDMLTLLKEQITALDIAAKKARQYQKYKEDLKKYEVASIVQHIIFGQKEIDRLKAEVEPKSKEFELLNTQMDQTEADLSQIRLSQVEKDETYVRVQDEFSQIKSGINLADERIQQASQREAELKERQGNLTLEIDNGEEKTKQSSDEIVKIQEMRKELSVQVTQLETEYKNKEAQIQALRDKAAELGIQETQYKHRLFDIVAEKTTLNNEQSRLTSLMAHCQAQAGSLMKESYRLSEQHRPVSEDITAKTAESASLQSALNDAKNALESAQGSIAGLEAEISDLQASHFSLKNTIVSTESKINTLKEWEQKDPVRNAMKAVLSADISGLRGPVSSLIRIDSGKEEVIAAALGDKLNYMVTDTAETAQKAIKFLEDGNLGRLSFVVMDRISEGQPASPIAQPDGAVKLLSMMHTEHELEMLIKFLCGDTLVSGRSIYGSAIIQGGGQITFEKPVLIEEQLRKLSETLERSNAELAGVVSRTEISKQSLAGFIEEKKNREAEYHKLNAQLEWLTKQLAARKDELLYIEKEIALNAGDIKAREEEEKEISVKLQGIADSRLSLENEEKGLLEKQENLEIQLKETHDSENNLAPLLTESKVAWATQSNELAGREREEARLQESIYALSQQIEQNKLELTAIETKIEEQHALQETESEKLKDLTREHSQKEVELQMILTERQDLMKELESKNTSIHNLRMRVESLKQEIHNTQLEQRSFELQKQTMEQRLQDDYALMLDDVKEKCAMVEVDDEEISRLKRKIESMGAVNLAAPEEYESLEERYNFLQTQQMDLSKAKEDLHQVITKINQTTRESFKKTFEQVREYFISIYHQLFEGGESDLKLTDEENLLECGVEIFAQPPGKKFQNITLLSGGEKALTAIALLFAFFMVKPSPFCILDEVDAPLDDANIGRYINMIKSFAEKSQFLVITHNKRTMEMADVLYGVTMEELGVSKIISVKMSKESELAVSA